jgi:hypothetical protein
LRYEVNDIRLISVEPFRRWQTDSQAIHNVLLHHVSKASKEGYDRGDTISLSKLVQIHSSSNINDEISSLGVIEKTSDGIDNLDDRCLIEFELILTS